MTRHNATEIIPIRDPLPVVLALMRALALSVLEEHTNQAGQCVMCSLAWPCERVVVATHNLDVI
jgi:hypothetical protein